MIKDEQIAKRDKTRVKRGKYACRKTCAESYRQQNSLAMKYPFCIKISCLVDRRRSSIVPWIPPVDRVSSRSSSGIRFSTVLAALGTCGTSGSPIARDPDPRTALILFGFELTDLSRSVLLQAIVPESCRSQAHRVSVEMHNYIELRYKLC